MKQEILRFDCVNKIKSPKTSLIRIVKTPEGKVEVDPTGKMNGHGAYIAPNSSTLELAKKNKALERTLGCPIPEEVFVKLGRYIK